ncbi:15234_t:CDS:2 [Funneliformis geosporum]|nr:15234_t:CDS:2 [Funneliformis geosporum]
MDNKIDNEICEICCEKRKSENCKGRAIIKFSNSSHYLQKLVDHNHSSQATDGNVANAVAHIKKQAKETRKSL